MDILVDKYLDNHPEHAARLLCTVSESAFLKVIQTYPNYLDKIISHMPPTYMAQAFDTYSQSAIKMICNKISANHVACILKLSPQKKQTTILDLLDNKKKKAVKELLDYTPDQIGFYAQSVALVLSENLLINDALNEIDKLNTLDSPIFVVDSNYHLIGSIDLFMLIKKRKRNGTLQDVTHKNIYPIKASTPLQNIAAHPAWEKTNLIPVVGKTDLFLGVIPQNNLSTNVIANYDEKELSALNGYILFSEILWNGLQRFWGSIR